MNLEEVKTKWNSLKNKEAELEKELEANRKEQIEFFKKAKDEGFYWKEGEWVKNELRKIIFRPVTGETIQESMLSAKEFKTTEDMKIYIVAYHDNYFSIDDIIITGESSADDRIGWKDSRMVCVKRYGNEDFMKKYNCPQCIGWCATEFECI